MGIHENNKQSKNDEKKIIPEMNEKKMILEINKKKIARNKKFVEIQLERGRNQVTK